MGDEAELLPTGRQRPMRGRCLAEQAAWVVADALPGLAAIDGFINAPVRAIGPFMARSGDIDDVGVRRMDPDSSDRVRAGQADRGKNRMIR